MSNIQSEGTGSPKRSEQEQNANPSRERQDPPPTDNMGVDNDTSSVSQPPVDEGDEPSSRPSDERVAVLGPSGRFRYVKRLGSPGDYYYKLALDTLQVAVHGEWILPNGVERLLSLRKCAESAQVVGNQVIRHAAHDGTELQVYPHNGRPWYRVLMRDGDGLEFKACPSTKMPAMIIRFGARWCVENEIKDLHRWILLEAEKLGFGVERICLSEVHIRCDVPTPFTADDRNALRGVGTRNASFNFHEQKGEFTGLNNLGGEKAIKFTLYDKRKEQGEETGFLWPAMWKAYGIADDAPIWRVEARFRRDTLKKCGLDQLTHLNRVTIKGLWHRFSSEYIVLADPDPVRADRAHVLPKWQLVQNCGEIMHRSAIDAEINWADDRLITQSIGCLASYISRSGLYRMEKAEEMVMELVDYVTEEGAKRGERKIGDCWRFVLKKYNEAVKIYRERCDEIKEQLESQLGDVLERRVHAKPWRQTKPDDSSNA